MSNVLCSRLIASAASAPMTTTFLAAIRASGVTRSAAGYVVDGAGVTHACYVNSAGNWDLTASLSIGVPVDAQTFADLRAHPAPYSRAFVNVAFTNGTRGGICVSADPSDPPDPG